MSITFGEARELLAEYAGRAGVCPSSETTYLFVIQVMQHLLYSGNYPSVRKFVFHAVKGCFTAPYELEVPLKVKIDGKVGNVWDKWYEFYQVSDMEKCFSAGNALYEEPNLYPTVYGLPKEGARVGAYALNSESCDAYLIVRGIDTNGKQVVTFHGDEQISGEKLILEKGVIKYTQTNFVKIDSIEKSKTSGRVQLLWINPTAKTKGLLSDYSPLEVTPAYRRFRLTTPNCDSLVKVSILGRIRLKEAYADNDVIPFDNLNTLMLAAQTVNSLKNNDPATAQAQDTTMQNFITRETEHKRVQNGQPIEISYFTSGGSIKNIIGSF